MALSRAAAAAARKQGLVVGVVLKPPPRLPTALEVAFPRPPSRKKDVAGVALV